jgi:hypothetical protein
MLGVWSKRANVWTKSRFPSLKITIETNTFAKSLIVLPLTNNIRSKKCFEKIMFLKKNSRSAGGRVCESLLRRYCVNNNCDLGYCPADRGVLGYYACYIIALYRPGLPQHGFHVNCAQGQVCCNVPYVF